MPSSDTLSNKITKRGNNGNNYSEMEIEAIKSAYKNNKFSGKKTAWLKELSIALNRPESGISRMARFLGISNRNRKSSINSLYKCRCVTCGKPFLYKTKSKKTCSPTCFDIRRSEILKNAWKKNGHPKGMLNKTHSKEVKKGMSDRITALWKNPLSKFNSDEFRNNQSTRMSNIMVERIKKNPSSIYSKSQKGWVDFSSGKRCYFRSGWEKNYAYYLEWLVSIGEIKHWDFEVDTFWFEKIKRGVRSYLPDFKVFNNDGSFEYHEVKGWMDKKSATKLKRMSIYFPKVKVVLIDEVAYKSIMKNKKLFLQ